MDKHIKTVKKIVKRWKNSLAIQISAGHKEIKQYKKAIEEQEEEILSLQEAIKALDLLKDINKDVPGERELLEEDSIIMLSIKEAHNKCRQAFLPIIASKEVRIKELENDCCSNHPCWHMAQLQKNIEPFNNSMLLNEKYEKEIAQLRKDNVDLQHLAKGIGDEMMNLKQRAERAEQKLEARDKAFTVEKIEEIEDLIHINSIPSHFEFKRHVNVRDLIKAIKDMEGR